MATLESPSKRRKLSHSDADGTAGLGKNTQIDTLNTSASSGKFASEMAVQLQKEAEVGITSFVSDGEGFEGILKKRYTDFLVNEILPSGEVLHLRNLRAPREPKSKEEPRVKKVTESAEGAESNTKPAGNSLDEAAVVKASSQATEVSSEDRTVLSGFFGDNFTDQLINFDEQIRQRPNLRSQDHGTIKASVPADREIRTSIHQAIRRIFSSRLESSTDHDGFMMLSAAHVHTRKPQAANGVHSNSCSSQGGRNSNKPQWSDRGGEYLHFTLFKENKDTMEVISYLSRQMRLQPKTFQFAGTKDRRGVTVQRVSAFRTDANRVAGMNKMLRGSSVGDFKYEKNGLELGDLRGNEFVVTLRDVKFQYQQNLSIKEKVQETNSRIAKALSDLRGKGYFNYYGLQRFGTFSTRTDSIGVKLLQGRFEEAVKMILAYSSEALAAAQDPDSTLQIGQEDKLRAKALHDFEKTGNGRDALEILPRKFSAECAIVRHLMSNNGKSDWLGALSNVQRNLRLMYVHAYQSLVWNYACGERWRLFEDKVVEGDLVMVSEHVDKVNDREENTEVDQDGEVIINPEGEDKAQTANDTFERARALSKVEAESGKYSIFDIVLPMPGYDILYPANAMSEWYKTFMASEQGGGLDPHDMRRKQKDYSLSGSYRKILARIETGATFEVRSYSGGDEQFVDTDMDVVKGQKHQVDVRMPEEGDLLAVVLKFQLGSSQYATMALRELLQGGVITHKPDFGVGR